MNMKKSLFLLILALFLSLGVSAWAEEGIEVVLEDGVSVVAVDVGAYTSPVFFGKANFVLPSSLVTVEDSAFEGIGAEKVDVSGSVSSIGARAFADCPNLTAIRIPATVDTIHDTAFEGSDGVTIYGERSKRHPLHRAQRRSGLLHHRARATGHSALRPADITNKNQDRD